jgi:excinuclease ABC subunit B
MLSLDELLDNLANLERQMKRAAKDLDFEQAALLRDEIARIKKLLPASGLKPQHPKRGKIWR